jgi:hypothetical protein
MKVKSSAKQPNTSTNDKNVTNFEELAREVEPARIAQSCYRGEHVETFMLAVPITILHAKVIAA